MAVGPSAVSKRMSLGDTLFADILYRRLYFLSNFFAIPEGGYKTGFAQSDEVRKPLQRGRQRSEVRKPLQWGRHKTYPYLLCIEIFLECAETID